MFHKIAQYIDGISLRNRRFVKIALDEKTFFLTYLLYVLCARSNFQFLNFQIFKTCMYFEMFHIKRKYGTTIVCTKCAVRYHQYKYEMCRTLQISCFLARCHLYSLNKMIFNRKFSSSKRLSEDCTVSVI